MLSKKLEIILTHILDDAKRCNHEYLTTEHLLLGLLKNSEVMALLRSCGVKNKLLKQQLTKYIKPAIKDKAHHPILETQPTAAFQRVLQKATSQAKLSGKMTVDGIHVLLAMFDETNSKAITLLKKQNFYRADIINYLSQFNHDLVTNHPITTDSEISYKISRKTHINQDSVLTKCSTNLNKKAKAGEILPLIGRDDELKRSIQILCRKQKNNPLYVGETGVGKTAIVEGLAQLIVNHKVPKQLYSVVIYALDLAALLAGTKYRGDFEKKLKQLVEELKEMNQAILFIDEIHTIIGAGASTGGFLDVANLLKPLLSNGDIHCIGSTTYQEYHTIFEKDRALARRFQKVELKEPNIDQTIQIIHGLKRNFEDFHQVSYSDEAIETTVQLADRHINDRFFPDKAIDIIDEAGACYKVSINSDKNRLINKADIEKVIAKMAAIPEKMVSNEDKKLLRNLGKELRLKIFGQEQAIDKLVDSIKLARSGLRQTNKPIASFLFIGPTGVGKTQVTIELAKNLGIKLLRFDMSEYSEKHTISRLLGAPPGYIGHDQGGLLTDQILKNPHAVVLLDEIEKAHHEIYNILLQIMDNGQITDRHGRIIDFYHTIIIMASNIGSKEASKRYIGFSQGNQLHGSIEATNHHFSSEFRNRLDAIIEFSPLKIDIIKDVAKKFVSDLKKQLKEKNVSLYVGKNAYQWLANRGYNQQMGARPMNRLIDETLKKPLAEHLLFGDLTQGGHVSIRIEKDQLKLIIKEMAATQ